MESIEMAAESAEEEGNYRRAYGFWKELIAVYGSMVNEQRLSYWKMHEEMCCSRM